MFLDDSSEPRSGGHPTLREFFDIKNVFTVRNVVIMGLLLAIRVILGLPFLTIYISGIKLISFSYLTDALTACLFGPWAALAFGFAGDTLGYFASMSAGGAYMPFYAISEMMTGFIFAVFLYKRTVKLKNVIIAWAINLVLVVLGMNSVWLMMVMGMNAGKVLTLTRFGINIFQFPIHIILTYMVTKSVKEMKFLHID